MPRPPASKAKPAACGDFVATRQVQIARWFGVTLSTVRFWSVDGMPGRPGHYDLAEICRWRLEQLDRRQREDFPEDEAKRKLREIQARSAEIDLSQKEREFVPAHFVEQIFDGFFQAMTRSQKTLTEQYGGQAHETMDICLAEMRTSRDRFDQKLSNN